MQRLMSRPEHDMPVRDSSAPTEQAVKTLARLIAQQVGAPNNSFNQSGMSLHVIRKIEGLIQFFPPG